ncbi:MAG: cell division protein FtsL [Burkholderiaceae bacterium]|nr:cell division protein FtsL [Burkholderiaceae bacterium]
MTRRQWILVALVTASALSLVNARYHERRLYTQMDRAERAGTKLDSDIEVLQVELTALRNPGRIDAAARRDLKMVPLRPTESLYYRPAAAEGKGVSR